MKKAILIFVTLAVFVALCALPSCSLPGGLFAPGSADGGATTTAGQGTTAAPQGAPLPSLDTLEAALSGASPTRARITMTTTHAALGAALSTDCYLLSGAEGGYYYYESEYFLPLAEAIAADRTVGKHTGHLLLRGESILSASGEIDGALLANLKDYSIRTPNLRASFFLEYTVTREGENVILRGTVDDHATDLIFDERLAGVTALAIELIFSEDAMLPIAFNATMTAEGGTPVTYAATYSYLPAPLPSADDAATPDLSLWE